MFERRSLSRELEAVRERHAPDALVVDAEGDFETLPAEALDELALFTSSIDPVSYPGEWLPETVPDLLRRFAGADFVVGTPETGSVAWTRQTAPPIVFVKPRVRGSPESFVDFLIAEALVEIGLDVPEHFLGFFEARYPDLDRAVPLDPASTYQIAAALYDGWLGLHTREVFADWDEASHPTLADAWIDAGERLEPRLGDLSRLVATGEMDFADATEYACGAIKHAIEPPAPFVALDTEAYRRRGAPYAVQWAETTFEKLGA